MRLQESVELAFHESPDEKVGNPDLLHLWLLDLDASSWTRAPPFLASYELARLSRMKDPVARMRLSSGFALKRRVLGSVTGLRPRDVSFVYGACGKPMAVSPLGHPNQLAGARFNISHSANVMVMAVSFSMDVGVDVEVIDLSKGSEAFYEEWTSREAVAKLEGVGIAAREHEVLRPYTVKPLRLRFGGNDVALAVALAEPYGISEPLRGAVF